MSGAVDTGPACTVCICARCGGAIERSDAVSSDWRHVGQRTWDHGAVPTPHPVLCRSVMAIRDREALGEFQCTEEPGHETDHRSGPSGVTWPRLEQSFGEPIMSG